MRSLMLTLAVAAMAVSSGCSLNSCSCNCSDSCPDGLLGQSGGRQLGNRKFFRGGGERLGLGVFEKGSECSPCDGGGCSSGGLLSDGLLSGGCSSGGCSSGGCSSGGCSSDGLLSGGLLNRGLLNRGRSSGGCSSGGCSSGGCSSGGCSSGGCSSGGCSSDGYSSDGYSSDGYSSGGCTSCESSGLVGRVSSTVRDRRATRKAATSRAATRTSLSRNVVSRSSATAIPAPVGMVEAPIIVDGPKTASCGLGSCGQGGCGCDQGFELGNRLSEKVRVARAQTTLGRDRQAGDGHGCGLASCGLGGQGCGKGCALRNHLPGGGGGGLAGRALRNDPYGGQIPHTNPALGPQGGAGGFTPTYQYPYYTTRGPRDFLNGNPPSIGPR